MKFEERLRREITNAGCAHNAARAHLSHCRYSIHFTKKKCGDYRHLKELNKYNVADLLTHLAADTQRVALSAVKFLYDKVLDLDIGIVEFTLSTKPKKLPVVMAFRETEAMLGDRL